MPSRKQSAPKGRTNRTRYMSDDAFANLQKALEAALAFERGEHRDIKVTRVPDFSPAENVPARNSIREKLSHRRDGLVKIRRRS